MYGYIYKTTNLVNGKIYIGKKVSKKFANYYKGSGKLIRAALLKYGKKNFICEILEQCSTNEELNNREQYYIKLFNSQDKNIGYNISYGGDGGDIFNRLSSQRQKEVLSKRSSSLKSRVLITNEIIEKHVHKNYLIDYLSKGFRLGMSSKHKAKLKHKHKILKKNKGWFKKGKSSWNKGIPCSISKKEKISKTLTGRKRSLISIKKNSESMKQRYKNGYINPQKGKVSWNRGIKLAWVANSIERHLIKIEELANYLNNGYHRGKKIY